MQRSRAALMGAAVHLVSERGTTAIPVTDLAEAANVSRQLIYLQFGDRDSLLVEAAIDLLGRELIPRAEEGTVARNPRGLEMAQLFAKYRSFYRAMLTGSCSFEMKKALSEFFRSVSRSAVQELFGELGKESVEDVAVFFTAGVGAIVDDWLIYADDPLDPEELSERLLRLGAIFAGSRIARAETSHVLWTVPPAVEGEAGVADS